MTRTQKQGPSKIIMLAPVALVLIVYGYLFNSPQQNQLHRAKTKLGTLTDSQHDTEHGLADVFGACAKLRKAERELKAKLDQERQKQSASIQHLTAMRRELLSPSLPVATVQNVSRLFGEHRLQILESQPEKASSDKARHSMKTLVALLVEDKSGHAASNLSKDIHREVYRLKLYGRFEDIRSALEALTEAHQNVVPLSLEMAPLKLEAADGQPQSPIWYLTIMV